MDKIALQRAEFDALTELAKRWEALRRVPVVDDDYPEYRHRYEGAVRDFIKAITANGRLKVDTAQRPATTELTFAEVASACLARSRRWHPGGVEDWSIADWAVAAAGEMGECCNAVKKFNRVRDGIANENDPGRRLETVGAAMAAIGEEAADTVIYLFSLAARCGFDLGAEIVAKFNATSERYGFPERLAVNAASAS